jgi:hypothetical protein
MVGKNIRESIKTSAKEDLGRYELKQHKSWFEKECVRCLDQRKKAEVRRFQEPN